MATEFRHSTKAEQAKHNLGQLDEAVKGAVVFDRECDEAQYTDVGDLWDITRELVKAAEAVLKDDTK